MSEEESGKSNKLPLICGGLSLASIFVLFFITEMLTDASVMLQTYLMCLLIVIIIPFMAIKIKDKTLSNAMSLIGLISTVAVCIILYIRRNKVEKILLESNTLDDELVEKILKSMENSQVYVLAGSGNLDLPEKLKKFEDIEDESLIKLGERLGDPTKAKDSQTISFSTQNVEKLRYSGLQRNLVLYIGGNVINKNNYERLNFKLAK